MYDSRTLASRAVEFLTRSPLGSTHILTKDILVQTGKFYWDHIYKGTESSEELADVHAVANFRAWVDQLFVENNQLAEAVAQLSHIPDAMISIMGSSRWVDQGLPTIRFGHKRLAALMATTISPENLQHVKAPWKAFFIEMPPELLYLVDDGKQVPVKGILVHTVYHPKAVENIPKGLTWNWLALTDTPLTQWSINTPIEMILGLQDVGDYWTDFGIPSEDHDQRVSVLIGRLICAVCLLMSSPDNFQERPASKNKKGHRGPAEAPQLRVFTDAQKIDIDVRPAVTAYLEGVRSTVPSARTLVMGHFKRQPYGPNSSLRKVIYVEPYWTHGSPDAPIEPKIYKG